MILCYEKFQPIYSQWETLFPNLKCVKGVKHDVLDSLTGSANRLLILDDLESEICTSDYISQLFTRGRHCGLAGKFFVHVTLALVNKANDYAWLSVCVCACLFLGIICLLHSILPKGRYARAVSLNLHGYIILRSPRLVLPSVELLLYLKKRSNFHFSSCF